jgi:hypothetical protein
MGICTILEDVSERDKEKEVYIKLRHDVFLLQFILW